MRDYRPQLDRRSSRQSLGSVYYPAEFRRHISPPNDARNPGSFPCVEPRGAASEPASPISRLHEWYMSNEWFASIIVGLFIAFAAAVIAYWIVS